MPLFPRYFPDISSILCSDFRYEFITTWTFVDYSFDDKILFVADIHSVYFVFVVVGVVGGVTVVW